MESSTQSPHFVQQASTMVTESTVLLNSAAEAENWSLVRELITSDDVTASDIRQSVLLEKLVTASDISHQLVVIITKELFFNETSAQTLKHVAQAAVIRAAQCDKWEILIAFLSTADTLLEDETTISLIQMITDNETLRENSYLHIDVLNCVWRHLRQKILDIKDKSVQNNLVQMAAKLSMWSLVCDLLDAQPDLNLLDKDGLSVLHRLVMCPDNRFDSLFSLLLKHGANVNLKTLKGDSALHLAAKHQKLIKSDAPLHLTDVKDCAQFKSEVLKEYRTKCAEAKLQVLSTLINSCHCVDDLDGQGNTAVIVAAENDNWEFLKLLLEHGARAESVDQNQRSVLHVLALKGSLKDPVQCDSLVTLCVNGGAHVNSIDIYGNSALHVAVQSKNWIFFKSLIGLGADITILNRAGWNVLHRLASVERQYTKDVSLLFSFLCLQNANLNVLCRTGYSALHIAARGQNWSLVKHLVHLGANIHLYDVKGFTVLHIVAMNTPSSNRGEQVVPNEFVNAEQIELLFVLDLLMEKGADLELCCSNGDTALQLAAKRENWIMVKNLIESGANIYFSGNQGRPLIQMLVQCATETHDDLQLFNLLYANGVTDTVRVTNGDSVLQVAARYEKWTIVNHMLKHQAGNVNKPDSKGCSVLHRMATSQSKTFKDGWNCSYVRSILGKSDYQDKHQLVVLIHLAAAARNVDVVHELLDDFDDVNRTDSQGFTVLHRVVQCCSSTSVAIIKRLVVKGADVDKRCPGGDTALQLAAKSGNCLAVLQLLQSGAMVDSFDNEGMSILHRLIGQPQLSEQSSDGENSIRLLVALFAEKTSINQKDPCGNTPLHLAIVYRQWGMAIELLTRGASLNDRDSNGYTVLHRVAQKESCPEVKTETCHHSKPSVGHLDVLDLIDHRVDIDSRDPCGNTALMLSAAGKNWDSVDLLLKKGAAVVSHDMEGLTVLHRLATTTLRSGGTKWSENLLSKVLEDLISRGAYAKARDPEGNTPLQLAAKHGNMDMVDRLLEFQDNVNETDSEGFTLLSRVAQTSCSRCKDITRRLVSKGADVNITCPDGKSPLLLSVMSKNWSVTSALWPLASKNNINTAFKEYTLNLHHLVEEECPSNLILLFYKNTTTMQTRLNGKSVLQFAIRKKRWDLVIRFLDEGECTDFEALTGSWVFHVLTECAPHTFDKTLILSLMPSDKLNINLRDDNGNTPLNILASSNSWSWIQPFAEHGADVNMPDTDGCTVLHKLIISSSWDDDLSPFVDTVVEFGADIHWVGPENKTAVMLALNKRNWTVFWKLIQLGACYDWAHADKYLLLKKVYHYPKRNVQTEKLWEIINFLIQSVLNFPPDTPSVLKVEKCFENGFISSESTAAKLHVQSGSDILERLQSSFEKCVRCSNWAVASLLLQSGPDIDIKRLIDGKPLIHVLVSLYDEDDHMTWLSFLTALLRRGLDISSRDDDGKTVLMKHKVFCSFRELNTNPKALCRVLLEKGVNPSMVDNMGNSFLTKIMKLFGTHFLNIAKAFFEFGLLSCKPQFEGDVSRELFIWQLAEAMLEVEPAVVKILVECGAISNSDLFLLSQEHHVDRTQELREDSGDSEKDDLHHILKQAATEVRSLECLCRIAVSRCLPLGVNRRDTVRTLPVPPLLKDYLLFSDVFSDLHCGSEIDEWYPLFEYFMDDEDNSSYYSVDNMQIVLDDDYDDDDEIIDSEDDSNLFL